MIEYRVRPGVSGLVSRKMELRELEPHEVRVRVKAISLNYRDLLIAKGQYPISSAEFVPCSDAAGYVLEVGADVEEFGIDDRVITSFFKGWTEAGVSEKCIKHPLGAGDVGVLADEIILPKDALVALPDSISYIDGCCVPCAGVTAYHALCYLQEKPVEHVYVQGTGGVSMWVLAVASSLGVKAIFSSRDVDKARRVNLFGATLVLPNDVEEIRRVSGAGVQLVVDVLGGNIDKSIACLAPEGVVAVVGGCDTFEISFSAVSVFNEWKRIAGVYVGSPEMSRELLLLLEKSAVRPVVCEVFKINDAEKAFRYFAEGKHFGKIVIETGGD